MKTAGRRPAQPCPTSTLVVGSPVPPDKEALEPSEQELQEENPVDLQASHQNPFATGDEIDPNVIRGTGRVEPMTDSFDPIRKTQAASSAERVELGRGR